MYSFSAESVLKRIADLVSVYNAERTRCHADYQSKVDDGVIGLDPKVQETYLMNIRNNDTKKISWSRSLSRLFCQNKELLSCEDIRTATYRPFCKKKLAYDKDLIELPSKWDSVFPSADVENVVICVAAPPLKRRFSVLMANCIQDYHVFENTFCFPLYVYEKDNKRSADSQQFNLYDYLEDMPHKDETVQYKRRSAISDAALKKFREIYGGKVEKEDIFYYLYAVLQCRKYIELYGDNLSKEMPRIPMLDKFPEYVRIGKELAKLHLDYEQEVDPASIGLQIQINKPDYTVEKMQFKKEGKTVQKDTIYFNRYITVSNIPARAYEYVVNGKSAIEWIMERYAVTIDKASGIMDDPNLYGDEKYIFNLLVSVIALSVKTQDLLDTLPEYKEI